jgi:restriction system protein
MAEITRKRTGELLRKLFEILSKHPNGLPAREALAQLQRSLDLSEYEKGQFASGASRFEQIVRFATIDCVKAGWLLKRKGEWQLTDAGIQAYQAYPGPEAFYKRAVKLYHEWKSSRADTEEPTAGDADTQPAEKASTITFEQAEERAWDEIEQHLKKMNPYDFQELVASLLRAMGYHVSWVSPPGRDGGLDILASADPLGTRPPRIKVQVKRVDQTIDVAGLRSFMALLGEGDVGLFVTAGAFTKVAEEEARTQEKRRVTLLDLEKLFDLWVENYAKLDETSRRLLPLKPIYFLAPEV